MSPKGDNEKTKDFYRFTCFFLDTKVKSPIQHKENREKVPTRHYFQN